VGEDVDIIGQIGPIDQTLASALGQLLLQIGGDITGHHRERGAPPGEEIGGDGLLTVKKIIDENTDQKKGEDRG